MDYRTFDEWKAAGFHVIKGQKSHKRNERGQAVFSLSQVSQNIPRSYGNHWKGCAPKGTAPMWYYADVDYDDALEWEYIVN